MPSSAPATGFPDFEKVIELLRAQNRELRRRLDLAESRVRTLEDRERARGRT